MAMPSITTMWPTVPEYHHDWAVVDVETSGLRAGQDRVLSLAVITLDASGRQKGEFSTLLNPGCDPGPVHIHGLTAARLQGAPTFEEIAPQVGALLQRRVLVAHNAQFDYDFLAHEFARTRSWAPVERRLCTLALNRQVAPPTPDLKLGTLAGYYGVRQERAHDALDDVRVLSGILRGSLLAAENLGLALPLLACPPRQEHKPNVPKTPCAFRNPGRLPPGGPLVQGMKIAITGDTRISREELVARSVAAGLNMMTSVSAQTSVVVTNDPETGSGKLRRAVAAGVPLADEQSYLRLLDSVQPGQPKETPRAKAAKPQEATGTPPAQPKLLPLPDSPNLPSQRNAPPAAAGKPLSGRRVLVLGGTHEEAAEARSAVAALGASAAVNLSARVTDVILLSGGENDQRMGRITSLGLNVRDSSWLTTPCADAEQAAAQQPSTPEVLPRGGVIDLSDARWTVSASWRQTATCEVDVIAFAVDRHERVRGDEDFVFYGAPEHPDGTVLLATDGPTEQAISADLDALPADVHKLVIAAAIDDAATFGDVGAIEISATCGVGAAPVAQATLDAGTTERTMLLAELYRRGDGWRMRAMGQGYDHGLADLARNYGVDIAD